MKSEKLTLLVVDDDEDQLMIMQRAFVKLDLKYRVQGLHSGNEAIAYLKGEGKFKDCKKFPFPGYIITDLQMNDGDGLAILEFLKNNPALSVIPVVIFSSSDDSDDVRHSYLLGASSYFVKPSSQAKLLELLQKIHQTNESPRRRLRFGKALADFAFAAGLQGIALNIDGGTHGFFVRCHLFATMPRGERMLYARDPFVRSYKLCGRTNTLQRLAPTSFQGVSIADARPSSHQHVPAHRKKSFNRSASPR